MDTIVCFGEVLLRFSPFEGCFGENSMPVYTGGAELNVCTALARWSIPVKYVTAMPENYLSEEIMREIQHRGIDISSIIKGGNRIGIYYLRQGTDLKHAGVIYDRAGSSFSQLQAGRVNWDKVLEGASWFHFSAISPALNQNVVEVCEEALKAAVKKKLTISVDLNYRSKLWQYGKKPFDIMPKLVDYCNVIMGNLWAAEVMLGIPVPSSAGKEKSADELSEMAHQSSKKISQQFPNCSVVANTFRFDMEEGIRYFATLYKDGMTSTSREFNSKNIVDKVGSGDCFMAGLIYGLRNNHASSKIINFAAAAAFGKMHELGDSTKNDVGQINSILQGHG